MSRNRRILMYGLLTGLFTAVIAFIVTVNLGPRVGGAAAICAGALGGFISFMRTRRRAVMNA